MWVNMVTVDYKPPQFLQSPLDATYEVEELEDTDSEESDYEDDTIPHESKWFPFACPLFINLSFLSCAIHSFTHSWCS